MPQEKRSSLTNWRKACKQKRPAVSGANRSETKTAVTRKAKGSHKVEIGWLHCEKQIRMKDGGATRNICTERNSQFS